MVTDRAPGRRRGTLTTLLPYYLTIFLPHCLTTSLPYYCLTALLPYYYLPGRRRRRSSGVIAR
eukprot:scaffold44092_cov34-Phaeocystis_antarctica.AAC.3